MQDVVRPDVRVHAGKRAQGVVGFGRAHAAAFPTGPPVTTSGAMTVAGSPSATSVPFTKHGDTGPEFAHHVHLVLHQQEVLVLSLFN